LNILEGFSLNTQISNFVKIRPLGAEFFHAAQRTGRNDAARSRFPQFCESACKEKGNPCLVTEELENVYQGFMH